MGLECGEFMGRNEINEMRVQIFAQKTKSWYFVLSTLTRQCHRIFASHCSLDSNLKFTIRSALTSNQKSDAFNTICNRIQSTPFRRDFYRENFLSINSIYCESKKNAFFFNLYTAYGALTTFKIGFIALTSTSFSK